MYKEPLGRTRHTCENIETDLKERGMFEYGMDSAAKMYLQEVGRGCGDWMELAKDRDRWRALVSTVMNFRVP